MRKLGRVRFAALGVTVLAGCGMDARVTPVEDGLRPCLPGEVQVVQDAPVGCDLVGDVNTLAISWPELDGYDYLIAKDRADQAGCDRVELRDVTPTGVDCDF